MAMRRSTDVGRRGVARHMRSVTNRVKSQSQSEIKTEGKPQERGWGRLTIIILLTVLLWVLVAVAGAALICLI